MTQTTLDFSSNIVDGTAGGGTGDNKLQVGDFIFTISAQGNWTANFDNGRLNFSEDASVGSENFSINITTASGDLVDFYDYTVSVSGSPSTIGLYSPGVTVDSTFWAGSGLGPGPFTYRTVFPGAAAATPAPSALIEETDVPGTTTSGTVSFSLDNVVFETAPNPIPNHAPTIFMFGQNLTYLENDSAVVVFGQSDVDTNDASQTFSAMTFTVSNVSGSGETLGVGGTDIVLTNGASGSISGGGSYSVSVTGGVATVNVSGLALDNLSMTLLINEINFKVAGENPGSADRVVTLVSVTDSGSSNNTAVLNVSSTVHVVPADDPPTGTATATLSHGTEGVPYVVSTADLLQGFSDPDTDPLSVSNLIASDNATVVNNGNGTYTITPAANFEGTITLNYLVTDGHGGGGPATQSFVIDHVDHVPSIVASGANPTYTENGSAVSVFTGSSAETGDAGQTFSGITLVVTNFSGSGEILSLGGTDIVLTEDARGTISAGGSYAVVTDPGRATISVIGMALDDAAMTQLIDSITFRVTGENPGSTDRVITLAAVTDNGGSQNTARPNITSTVHVVPTNDDPTGSATATLIHGTEDTPYTVTAADLLQGFTDPDGDSLAVSGLTASDGAIVTDNGNDTYTITPAANFNGTVTLTYSVIDGNDGSKAATRSFILDATNDAPTGSPTATLPHGTEDTPYVVSATQLLEGLSDVDGDTLTIASLIASGGATVTDNGNDTYTITPSAGFNGAVTLTYLVSDSHDGTKIATQSFTFDAENDAPTGSATATLSHGTEDTPYTVTATQLLQGFSDPDGDTVMVSGLTASGGATVTDNGDHTYTITPAANLDGTVTLSYSVIDGHGGSKAATQSFILDGTNDAPTGNATADLSHGTEDTPYVVSATQLLEGLSDVDGDTLTVSGLTASGGATVTDNGNHTYTITPAANFNGVVTLTYSVGDGHGGTKAATQSFTVDAANDAPTGTATATLAHGTEDSPYVVSATQLLQGFSDIDGDTPAVSGLVASGGAMVTDNGNHTYTITPAANFNGAVTLSYSVIDSHGGSKAATQSFIIDAANDAPTGSAIAVLSHGAEDSPYVVSATQLLLGFSDIDGDTPTVSALAASDGATVTDNGDGTYTITPTANFNGAVTLSYSVGDGHGGIIAATQSVTFDAANDAPTASNDSGSMNEGTPKAFDVLANDTDIDSVLSAMNAVVTSHNGSVSINGDGELVVSYTGSALNVGETAQVVVTYDATDGAIADAATLTVTVTGVYDPGDEIDGSNKGDTINGTGQGERIDAGGGNDTINGRGGDDDISGGFGNDIAKGGAGDDNMRVGQGNDHVSGGAGDDRIVGWGGDDILTGGKGSDLFVFHLRDGNDTITDFIAVGADHDRIDLSALDKFENFAAVKAAMHQDGHATVIDLPGDNSITLKHVDMAMLSRDDFVL